MQQFDKGSEHKKMLEYIHKELVDVPGGFESITNKG